MLDFLKLNFKAVLIFIAVSLMIFPYYFLVRISSFLNKHMDIISYNNT